MFSIEQFDIELETEILGRNFYYIEELDSTNQYLLEHKTPLFNGTTVLAENQLNGKGRRDRNWISHKEQSLTFSVLLIDGLNEVNPNLVNLATSLSVAQAIENLFQLDVELKWPNDVLIRRKKVAGILLESTSHGRKLEKLILGIGINVNQPNFKGKFLLPPTSVRMEFGKPVSREKLLSEILNIMEPNLIIVEENPLKILDNWRERCDQIGENIKISGADGEKYGIFENINDDGYLLLRIKDKVEIINNGDVSLRFQ